MRTERIPVDAHTFDKDALIFDHGQVKKVGLVDSDGTKLVTLLCPDALSVGIWAPAGGKRPLSAWSPGLAGATIWALRES